MNKCEILMGIFCSLFGPIFVYLKLKTKKFKYGKTRKNTGCSNSDNCDKSAADTLIGDNSTINRPW